MTTRTVQFYKPHSHKSIRQIIKEQENEGYEFAGSVPGDYSAPLCEYHTADVLYFRKKEDHKLSDEDVDRIAKAVLDKIKLADTHLGEAALRR